MDTTLSGVLLRWLAIHVIVLVGALVAVAAGKVVLWVRGGQEYDEGDQLLAGLAVLLWLVLSLALAVGQ